MADIKISDLPQASALDGSEMIPATQGGTNPVKIYVSNILYNAENTTKYYINELNIDKLYPLSSGYYTLSTAISAVATQLRSVNAKITFKSAVNTVETWVFTSTIDGWNNISFWEKMPTKVYIDSVISSKTDFFVQKDNTNYIRGWVADSYINASGVETHYTGLYASTPIYLEENTPYYWFDFINGYYAFYNASGNVIEAHGNNSNTLAQPFTVPSGTVYMRITLNGSAQTVANAWISTSNAKPLPYAQVIKSDLLPEKEILDNSITSSKIADNSITSSKIADNSITSSKIADNSVISSKTDFFVQKDNTNYIRGWVADSYINASGVETNFTGLYASTPIYLKENIPYYWFDFINGYYAFYNASGNVIEAHGNNSNTLAQPFTVPSGTVYMRITLNGSAQTVANAWISTSNAKPLPYAQVIKSDLLPENVKEKIFCDYDGDDIVMFSKGVAIGDSLTSGTFNYLYNGNISNYINIDKYSYPKILSKITGIPIDNLGMGGMSSDEWYSNKQNADLSGYDFAIIQLGVNDAIRYSGWTDVSITAFTSIINKLKLQNTNIKIFVSTIIPATSYTGSALTSVSNGIKELINNLADNNVILLEMDKYGHTADTPAYNCGHLSAYGYWRLAKDYKSYISYYISKNKLLFREVQFIGTSYHFS